ncbi:L-lactate dehydrogenase complex protein LldG [Micromonospora rhizosphaerae]|uniref:L-lactate dehydrogenase complex protein LldG n=1 Tax=Micromonospora rhizosphaerae TaxID=568872 RepID=A0A1C6S231_9ACTN|nr:LUD domain-containing protein [Micromonospora rhizosphaerae]SCL23541.1 L-lactate dehydrogenase complex protein LldG [Micromonospora rhizosphaerae]
MNARDTVLARLRAALAGAPPAVPAPAPGHRRQGELPPGHPELVDLLARRLTDYRAEVHRVAEAAVADAVADILASTGGAAVVVPPGLPAGWRPGSVEVVVDDDLPADRLAELDGVVTAAAVAVAETGTIVLDAAADQGRRVISLLPDLHVCVVRPDQVVATVPEAVARLTPGRPLTWISGPSATSDIELNRVEGVHGPRRLHVIVTDE